jgi:hypothetical protein
VAFLMLLVMNVGYLELKDPNSRGTFRRSSRRRSGTSARRS